ncbi:MAG TPA: cache domain-containing protein [Thermoanaerobaculia bacterium]|jgi:signal transduction histidine kinase
MRLSDGPRLAAALIATFLGAACNPSRPTETKKTDLYLYEDTRRLVNFVEAAATLVEQRGTAAFAEFDQPRSRWRTSPTYLFVYDAEGTCVWHGLNRELVGRNLLSLRDALGKPVVEMVTAIGKRPERDAADWIFYLWEERVEFVPTWKSSYVRKAVAPGGKVFLVGSGSSSLKVEKVFVHDAVDAAARLLEERGRVAAFQELKEPSSRFQFLGSYIFVLDARGRFLIDPAYPTISGRDMSNFRDAIGRPVVRELLAQLRTTDTAWIQFLWPRQGETLLSRKLMYVRKVNAGGETLLVGSDFFVATPVWMRL